MGRAWPTLAAQQEAVEFVALYALSGPLFRSDRGYGGAVTCQRAVGRLIFDAHFSRCFAREPAGTV